LHDRLFRSLLRLLPEEFRAGYARDLTATFRAGERESGGRAARLRLWLATAADIVRVAPREHWDVLARDTRFAVRAWSVRPVPTLAALATLAAGIGANVAMFAVVDGVLLRPLPYRDPDALVSVTETSSRNGEDSSLGYLTFADLRARARSLETWAATASSTATLAGDGRAPERVKAMRVSHAYFDLLGVRPALGRVFADAEDRPGTARRVAVISDALWRRRFDADPAIVGRPLDVGGTAFQVIGVAPRAFDDLVSSRLYDGAEIWFPLGYDPSLSYACRTCRHLRVFGRLAPGVTPAAAAAELGGIVSALEAEHPSEYAGAGARVTPLADVFLGPVRPVLLVLWAGVVVLLLVACANVANLLLLRATERTREIAVRAALGVTRGRLVRQLVTESLVLSLAGGALGLVLAAAGVRALLLAAPPQLPRLATVGLDARAAGMALAIVVGFGLAASLVPIRRLVSTRAGDDLRGAGARTADASAWRLRAVLVGGNVALATLLLIGGGLLVRSLTALLAVSPGFDPAGVATLQLWLSGARFTEGTEEQQVAAAVRFYDELLARARALPGVSEAAGVTTLPLGGGVDGFGLHVAGRPHANPESAPSADRFVVTPGYFAALRIPLVDGRLLGEEDRQGGAPVAVVNQTLARALFPAGDAIGQQVSLGPPTAVRRTIVGVVGDVRHHGLDRPVQYQVYVPQAQWIWAETAMTVVARGAADPAATARALCGLVREMDPAQPVTNVAPLEDVVVAATATRRFAATLLTAFAAIALFLAAVGLYGALGVLVAERRREIAVRLALGAAPDAIRRLVLAQGLGPVLGGLAAGIGLGASAARTLGSLLYDVPALDPWSFTAAAGVLLAAAGTACLAPAWRAARIDPAAALRAH
jgi:putative ABC transport system permease protein